MGGDENGAGTTTGEQQQDQVACTSNGGSGQDAGSVKEAALLKAAVESLRAGLREKEDIVTELASIPAIGLCLVKWLLLSSYRVHAFGLFEVTIFTSLCPLYVRFCCRRKGHICVAKRTTARKPRTVLIAQNCKWLP